MIPGIFSWANTIPMGKEIGATPNGRHAGEPISHGSNPDPGFRRDGAPTAMAVAIASVQPGYGNTAPMQMELDPLISNDEEGVALVADLIRTHFDLGGTQINLNIMDAREDAGSAQGPEQVPRPGGARDRLQRLLRQPLPGVPPAGGGPPDRLIKHYFFQKL